MNRVLRLLWVIWLCIPALRAAAEPGPSLNIGVQAIDSTERQTREWQPIVDYLQKAMDDVSIHLTVFPLDDLNKAVQSRNVDIVITGILNYLELKHRIGLSVPLATLMRMDHGRPVRGLGGTILIRADRTDITDLQDLRKKRIATVETRSLGCFLSQAFELHKVGISLPNDAAIIVMEPLEKNLLSALLKGQVDALFVRSGTLETWQNEGQVGLGTLSVLAPRMLSDYPYAVSTPLYPDWPVAAMPHLDEKHSKRLTAAMLQMPVIEGNNEAFGIYGFSLPADYDPVHHLARHLRVPPYDQEPVIHFIDIWQTYRWMIVSLSLCIAAVLILLLRTTVYASRLNKARKESIQNAKWLDQERTRLRTLLKTIPDMVWLKDTQGVFLFCNSSFEPLVGATEEYIIGKTDYDFVDRELADFFYEKDRAAMESAKPTTNEEWLTYKDGSYSGLFQTIKTPMWDADGRLIGVLGVARNITEKMRAEKELENYRRHLEELVADRTARLNETNTRLAISEERYEQAMNATNDGLWDWNLKSNISYCSPSYFRMLGYEPGELDESTQKHFIDLLHPEDRDEILSTTKRRLEEEGGYELEFRMQTKNGGTKWILSRGKVVERDEAGRPIRAVGTHTDLTARKQMEIELIQAKEQAEAAMRAKSEFIANMSHEIRTPMNAIIGFAHLIKRDPLTPRQLDQLSKLSDAAHHLLQILNAILDFSKIEARKITLEIREFDPARIIDHVCSIVSEKAMAKKLDLLVDLDHVHLMLRGDDLRLGQILINIVGNAVKFTEEGYVSIALRIASETADSVALRFEIRDTGIGMSPDQTNNLFQAFEQADSSITRRFGGTGLGLAISKRLVELMNGRIGVESEIDRGTLFWMEIPFEKSSVGLPPPPVDEEWIDQELSLRQGAHILLVEDNPINQDVACEMLESAGMRVDTADNGCIAVEMAGRTAFDLILMDVQMPVMDGLHATGLIRKLPGYNHVPILAMTANAFESDREQCLKAGMNDHVAKPVEPQKLYQSLITWLPVHPASDTQPLDSSVDRNSNKSERKADISALKSVSGLNLTAALGRVMGNESLYLKLLRQFVTNHAGDADRLSGCLAAQDLNAVRHMAHTLKGVAGTIGAVVLEQAALELEKSVRRNAPDTDIDHHLDLLTGILTELLHELGRVLSDDNDGADVSVANRSEAAGILNRMEPLLATHDAAVNELFEQSKSMLRATLGHIAEKLGGQIDNFDYSEALITLRAARQTVMNQPRPHPSADTQP